MHEAHIRRLKEIKKTKTKKKLRHSSMPKHLDSYSDSLQAKEERQFVKLKVSIHYKLYSQLYFHT